jgi:DNA-binding GntR family transcriptional regulator
MVKLPESDSAQDGMAPLRFDGRDGSHRTLAERVFNDVRRAIVSGELRPGRRLPIEELAQALDVSPMPVREALRRLEAVGLVEHAPHRGARVSVPSADDLADLVRARIALEPLATSLAADGFADEQGHLAEAALGVYHAAATAGDVPAAFAADFDFHFTIYRSAGSAWLMRLITPLWESSERYRRAGAPGTYEFAEREAEHGAILDALSAHDGHQAGQAMQHHLDQSAKRIARSLTA